MEVAFQLPQRRDGRPTILAVGNFDGVHRGHRQLLATAVGTARELGGEAAVLTFEPHPRCVLDPDNCPAELTTLDEKRQLVAAAGADRLVVLPFTRALSRQTAEEFCERLVAALPLRRIVAGHDLAVGHGRRGDIPFLRAYGAAHGFDVDVVPPVMDGDAPISSSRVRVALADGDVGEAARLLGRPYFVDGWVEHGDRRGSRIGYPTANLAVAPNKCLPARGVYATWARVGGGWVAGATNVGYRPTFGGDALTVETHLLDFEGDIYRERLRLAFAARLRDEEAFPTAEALVERIGVDVEQTRRLLASLGEPAGL